MTNKMNLTQLNKEIALLNTGMDKDIDALTALLDKYQNNYEKMLLKTNFDLSDGRLKQTMANFNKAQSMKPISKLGFNEIAVSHIRTYDNTAKEQLVFAKKIGISADIGFRDLTQIKILKNIDYSVLWQEAEMLDALVKKQLVNAIASNANYTDTVNNLANDLLGQGEKMGKLARFSETYMRTALADFSRIIDQEIENAVGGDDPNALYIYAGPVDARTRDFCVEFVGEIKTRKEWEQIGDSEGVDMFSEGAGWNCRHRLILWEE